MTVPHAGLVLEAVLNGLWQGLVLTALAWCLLKLTPATSAAVRHLVWHLTLMAVVALPVVYVGSRISAPPQAREAVVMDAPAPFAGHGARGRSSPLPIRIPSSPAAWILLGAWFAASAALGARLAGGYLSLRRFKKDSEPAPPTLHAWSRQWQSEIPAGRTPRLRTSARLRLPVTAGLVKPAILFPKDFLSGLTEQETHSIWLHEMAHVRRWDDWTKLAQKLAAAVLFFHPAVQWISGKLSLEREIACDDWVVSRTGAPRPYAACLAKLAEYASRQPHPSPALAMAADRKQIFRRVEMLTCRNRNSQNSSKALSVLVVTSLVAAFAGVALMQPVFVMAQENAPAPETAAVMPPVAPEPQVRAEPSPAPNPRPHPELAKEIRALTEEMRPTQEEIRELAREISEEARKNIQPHAEQIRELAEQIREKIQEEIHPSAEEIRKLQEQVREHVRPAQPDEETLRGLKDQIADIERNVIRRVEKQVEALEDQIASYEEKMHPSEEAMKRLEAKMKVLEKELEKKAKEIEQRVKEFHEQKAASTADAI